MTSLAGATVLGVKEGFPPDTMFSQSEGAQCFGGC